MTFEAILSLQQAKPKRWWRITLVVSLALHGGALLAGLVHSIWQVDEMPMPAVEVTLTAAPPPPPPPPPPPKRSSGESKPKTRKPVQPKPETLVQPKETPKEAPKPEPKEEEVEQGQVGGVAGGVAGGVVGGVIGGMGTVAPPPPPPKPAGPKNVSSRIARGQLLINPNVDPYRVTVPSTLARSGMEFSALLRVCVSAEGRVTGVYIQKSAGPAIDPQFPQVIGRWRFRPLLADGRPTPFCYPLRYEVSAR